MEYWSFRDDFYAMRRFTGGPDNPITPAMVFDYERHRGSDYEKWQREALFAMDAAFRRAYNDVVKFHMQRKQIKLSGSV